MTLSIEDLVKVAMAATRVDMDNNPTAIRAAMAPVAATVEVLLPMVTAVAMVVEPPCKDKVAAETQMTELFLLATSGSVPRSLTSLRFSEETE